MYCLNGQGGPPQLVVALVFINIEFVSKQVRKYRYLDIFTWSPKKEQKHRKKHKKHTKIKGLLTYNLTPRGWEEGWKFHKKREFMWENVRGLKCPQKCEIIEQPKKSNNFFNEIDRNIDIFRYIDIFMVISILILKYRKLSVYRYF